MSDGPYKSLSMPRHWKNLAKLLENSAYSLSEKDEAARFALSKGTKEIPLIQISKIFNSGILFPQVMVEDLEKIRASCLGSSIGNIFIDCAREACLSGLTGKDAVVSALGNTLRSEFEGHCRSIHEHYLRKDPRNKYNIQEKLKVAKSRCDYNTMAKDFVDGKNNKSIKKYNSLDEGPEL